MTGFWKTSVLYLAAASFTITCLGKLADFNNDGVINAADYTVWRDTAPHMPEGYDLWRSKFGAPGGSGGAGQAVPEPSTVALALILVIAPLIRPEIVPLKYK